MAHPAACRVHDGEQERTLHSLSQVELDPHPGTTAGRSGRVEVDSAYISHYVANNAENKGRTSLRALGQVPVGIKDFGFDELALGKGRDWFTRWQNSEDTPEAHSERLEIRN